MGVDLLGFRGAAILSRYRQARRARDGSNRSPVSGVEDVIARILLP
jgi:hypothetical protein